jgi:chromate transporter
MERSEKKDTSRMRRAAGLFLYFFKVGFYTFGGGWSIVAQIQKEYIEKRHWLTEEELLDITSVGRSLPGLMIGNVSYLFGYHVAGFPGAIACVLGITIPSLLILTVVTWCYNQIKDNIYVSRAMTGVRASVAPIIASAALNLRKGALTDRSGYLLLLLGFGLYLFLGLNCILIVLLGGLLGFLICTWREKKGGARRDPS